MSNSVRAVLAVLLGCGLAASVERGSAQQGKDPPENPHGLKMQLIAKQEKYILNMGNKSAEEYRKQIEAIAPDKGNPPPGPKVDLALEIANPSDQDVTIWIGGDETRLSVELKGPGAVSKVLTMRMTADIKTSKAVVIPAGKTYTRPMTDLGYPHPRPTSQWYWTSAGEYTLSATWKLSAAQGEGTGPTLVAAPIKLQVTVAKGKEKSKDASLEKP